MYINIYNKNTKITFLYLFLILVHHKLTDNALVFLLLSLRAVEPDQSQLAGNRWPTNPVFLSRHRCSYVVLSISFLRIFLSNPTMIAFPFSASLSISTYIVLLILSFPHPIQRSCQPCLLAFLHSPSIQCKL